MSEDQADTNPNKKRGKKKRKNFLSNAKKYAKKGQMGRGTQMPEELYQYFVGILEAMKKGIEDEDERQSLVNNVLERTKDQELNIIGNQLGCRVIELLLPHSTAEDLERFIEIITPELRKLCSDNFTSHVVETILSICCQRATESLQIDSNPEETEDGEPKKKKKKKSKTEKKYTENHIQNCYDFTIKLCKYALNNLEDFVWDSYANHILRSALKCLSGITLLPGEKPKVNMFVIKKEPKFIPPNERTITYKEVPQEFKDLVLEFTNRLSLWPQFKDLPYQNLTSALLQVMLYALKNVDEKLCKTIVTRLLNESFAPDDWASNTNAEDVEDKKDVKIDLDEKKEQYNEVKAIESPQLPPVFGCESAVRLLEAALFVSKKKAYTQLYAKCFICRLAQLSTMPMLNFTVQRLFDNCTVKDELESMFDEISESFGALLACGNTGVLVAAAKACLRTRARQTQFINSLESSLNCTAPEHQKYFPVACLRLLPVDRIDLKKLDKDYFIHVHGSVILQTILQFERPMKAVNGLLELSTDELMVIFCDAKGCHVADTLVTSQRVGVKARLTVFRMLRGFYQKLALSQYGSRALEQIFQSAAPEQRVTIMTELSDKSNLLNGTQYGRIIAEKLNVQLFIKSQDNWKKIMCKEISNK